MTITVTIKFIGSLRHITGKSTIKINCPTNSSIKDLIHKILSNTPNIKTDIIHQQPDGTIKNLTLILVNDREINVLNGLDTILTNNDKVVFIPVTHGG
ncbi:MAG: MoaD/ThiS family protein [Candidatus Bathyarchaeota archaeon]|nr:MoaD/ThiS family protein [Candidatus Termiticorpusculum sp.]